MSTSLRRLLASEASAAVVLICLLVGAVFVSEGLKKFLFPDDSGVGRITTIGIPSPDVLAPFVEIVEIVGGLLLLLGLRIRLAAIPLIVNMLVALATTKIPILAKEGFGKMVHEARTDWSMLLGSFFLLLVGA
jgi:putative oxidoreductase